MKRLNLDQLRAFERIARLGTFHAAARELGLTQPSISQRVRELERTLDAHLFTRRGPKISLTIEGRALLDYAARMLAIEAEVAERFESRDPLKGLLRLGANDSFGLVCLVDLMRRLEMRYPLLKVSVQIENSSVMSRMLNDQAIDIAVVSEPDVEPHVQQVSVGCNELAWFAAANLGLHGSDLSPHRLASEHVMLIPPPSRLYDTVTGWFAASGVTPSRISTCNNLSVMAIAIAEGAAIGVVPVSVMQRDAVRTTVRRLNVSPPISGHSVAICYQSASIGPGIEAVVSLARQLIVENALFLPA